MTWLVAASMDSTDYAHSTPCHKGQLLEVFENMVTNSSTRLSLSVNLGGLVTVTEVTFMCLLSRGKKPAATSWQLSSWAACFQEPLSQNLATTLWEAESNKEATLSCFLLWIISVYKPVLVSCGCCNKLPQTWWLNTTEIHSLTVLKCARSLKARCQLVLPASGSWRQSLFHSSPPVSVCGSQ